MKIGLSFLNIHKPVIPIETCQTEKLAVSSDSFIAKVTSPSGERIVKVNSISALLDRMQKHNKKRGI